MRIIKISDHTISPGLGLAKHSDNSGEYFSPMFLNGMESAIINDWPLFVDLDGTIGYPHSFFQKIFKDLSCEYGKDVIFKHLVLKSDEEPYLIGEILEIIEKYDDNFIFSDPIFQL